LFEITILLRVYRVIYLPLLSNNIGKSNSLWNNSGDANTNIGFTCFFFLESISVYKPMAIHTSLALLPTKESIAAQQWFFCYKKLAPTFFFALIFSSGKQKPNGDQIKGFYITCSVLVQCLFSDDSVPIE